MNVSNQEKGSVLQEHILDDLVTRHDFGREDLTELSQKVTLFGVELGTPLHNFPALHEQTQKVNDES
jgi:hypothetical protein